MSALVTVALSVTSIADALAVATAAAALGGDALRISDRYDHAVDEPDRRPLDPTVVIGYLAAEVPGIGYVLDLSTSRAAPYNAARRALALDRITDGGVAVLVRADGKDPLSARADDTTGSVPPEGTPADPGRWADYVDALGRVFRSFPADAIVGDQHAGVFADPSRIEPADHHGPHYRVAGASNQPTTRQGWPPIVSDQLDVLGPETLRGRADLVVVPAGHPGIDGVRTIERRVLATGPAGTAPAAPTVDDPPHIGVELVVPRDATVPDTIAALRRTLPALGDGTPVRGPSKTFRERFGLGTPERR